MAADPTNDLSTNRNKIILVGAVVAIVLIVIAFFVSNDRQGTADQNRAPLIAYLAPDDNGLWQLFVAEADGSEATRLTSHDQDIHTFSVAPDGDAIVYALSDKNGGSAVWLVDPRDSAESEILFACPDELCTNPIWTPSGDVLLIERAEPDMPQASRLWWLTRDGETTPVFSDESIYGQNAQFSPDGRQIAFFNPSADAIILYDRETGANTILPTTIMTPVVWHPDGSALLFRDMQAFGEQFGIRMLRYDVDTGDVTNLTVDMRDDELPAIWTDEDVIIFGRKRSQTAMGRQLWSMNPDGTLHALTANADVQYSVFSLSPDQESILMQQFNITTPGAQPGIWQFNRASGAMQQVVPVGIQPQWLP
ncbi:MAG: hypothetical protein M9930_01730 [Anaerolineae bacterium]|nr:hypothetical protein [Anaerolineae bacterium]